MCGTGRLPASLTEAAATVATAVVAATEAATLRFVFAWASDGHVDRAAVKLFAV